jgi:hypothetical protein
MTYGSDQHEGMDIQPGILLEATTATGEHVHLRAISAAVQGRDFAVVWVCSDQEYERALSAGDDPDGIPWPLDAVRVLEQHR